MSGGAWLALAALAAAGLAGLDLARAPDAGRIRRLGALLLALAALASLATNPGNQAGGLTILTPGAPATATARDAISLDRLDFFPAGRPITLVGWGLLAHEWPLDTGLAIALEASPPPRGITRLEAPAEVALGERLLVEGEAMIPSGESAWVMLDDPAGSRDSALVTADAPGFRLAGRPRATGSATYRLSLTGPGLEGRPDTLGLAVRPAMPLTILILDASPSFETAYLKRWLAERGARVLVRTAITRGRYRTERINGAPDAAGGLSAGLLAAVDAVLADGGSLLALSDAERARLERAVREDGLGLLLTADPERLLAHPSARILGGFALTPLGDVDHRATRPIWSEAPRRSLVGIEASGASLTDMPGTEPLVRDEQGRPLSQSRPAGAGRIAITLLRAPSRWVLEKEPELFAAYWSTLIAAVARDTLTRVGFTADGPIRANHPMTLTLITGAARPGVTVRSPAGVLDTIALARDPFVTARWTGRYWPREAGWHEARLAGGRTIPFRVTQPSEWMGVEAAARLAATRSRVDREATTEPRASPEGLRLLAFLVLVSALTWLWVESRRSAGLQ